MINALHLIGRSIIPRNLRPNLREHLLKAGYVEVPYSLFGALFIIAGALTALLHMLFFATRLGQYGTLEAGFLTFIVFTFTMFLLIFTISVLLYFYWNIKIYHRTKELELLLPDYLTLVSTNLKGGMSFENALWNSIKPEFGILANEIGLASKRVMTGNDVSDALMDFAMKYESPILRRNIQLMISEVESGGKIVETIDRIIADMKKTQILKKEMAANTITYMIFIGMLVIFICPILFALSLQLFTIISGFISNVAGTMSSGAASINIHGPQIDIKDFRIFSVLAIAIISVCSSLIIAIIEKGTVKSGLKYIPMFLITSLFIYFVASGILSYAFQGIKFGP